MAVGRKPIVQKNENEPVILEGEFANAMGAMRDDVKAMNLEESQHQAHVRAVALQVGYQLPNGYADPDLIQRDIAANMRRTAEAMLQVGIGLICLKEACQHGEFISRLAVLGFDTRVAQKYMHVAKRLSNASSTTHLLKVVESQTKLLELIVLDDDQIEELVLTGETGGLKRDEVNSMSVKELRAKVRELQADKKANEERLAVKDQQRNEAEDQARGFKKLPPDEQVDALLAEATKALNAALAKVNGEFRQALLAVEALDQHAAGIKDYRPLAAGLVGQLQQSVTIIRDEFMLTDIVGDGAPEWMRATAHLKDGE